MQGSSIIIFVSVENKGERTTTLGGGTGTPIVNEALIKAGVKYINSIVTVMDDGGATQRRRIDSYGREISFGDSYRILLSLRDWENLDPRQAQAMEDFLSSRDIRERVLGQEFFSHFYNRRGRENCREETGFEPAIKLLENLTLVPFLGTVIPVTLESTNIVFVTESGRHYKGEHNLDDLRMSKDTVESMWLEPSVLASPKAIDAIENSDLVIFSCGSLHGSVLSCLLPRGIPEALKKSHAIIALITNLTSTRNETHNFSLQDFCSEFRKYSRDKSPDILIVPQQSRVEIESKFPDVSKAYNDEGSYFLGWEPEQLYEAEMREGVRIVTHNAVVVATYENRKMFRHDPSLLSLTLTPILEEIKLANS